MEVLSLNRSFAVVSLLVFGLLGIGGCSNEPLPNGMPDLQPLVLTVTQQGAPLEGATVQLISADPSISRWASGGVTNSEGQVNLKTLGQYEGVVPGTYKVTVYKMAFDGDSTPAMADSPSSGGSTKAFLVVDPKYQAETTTPVKIEVAKGIDTLPAIDIGAAVKITQMPI